MHTVNHTSCHAIEQLLSFIDQLPNDYDEFDPMFEDLQWEFAVLRLQLGNR